MPHYLINGGKRLDGTVEISPAKNAVLPIMCASLMIRGKTLIKDCPRLGDVMVMCDILKGFGAKTAFTPQGLLINAENINNSEIDGALAGKIRASFFLVGALISRLKWADCPMPGGCKIGTRPIDIHLAGLKALGVEISVRDCRILFDAKNAKASRVRLRYPSVGATENLIMAAVFLKGDTYIENCATEPEIKDLVEFLNIAGAKIYGGGTRFIRVCGVENLTENIEYKPIPDRIEAGTFLLATYLLGGKVYLKGANTENIFYLIKNTPNNSCKIYARYVNIYEKGIYIVAKGEPISFGSIVCAPYPLFPTDLQPILGAVAAASKGITKITETVFDSRFLYLEELFKMGAKFSLKDNTATIVGAPLFGEAVEAKDLRGGAALVLAGLKASGVTKVLGAENVMRGYLDFDKKLTALGADITLID